MKSKSCFYLTVITLTSGCQIATEPNSHTGYIETETRVISSPRSGWIRAIHTTEGALLTQGDLVFELDKEKELAQVVEAKNRIIAAQATVADLQKGARSEEIDELIQQLKQQQAKLSLAESEWKRIKNLIGSGTVTQSQLDLAKSNRLVMEASVATAKQQIVVAQLGARPDGLLKAQAELESTKAQLTQQQYELAQRQVVSDITGIVHDLYYHQGEFVNAGTAILSIYPRGELKARFYLNQSDLTSVQINQQIHISADGLNAPLSARISYISDQAEFVPPVIYSKDSRDKLVFLIEAKLPENTALKPGMPVDVNF